MRTPGVGTLSDLRESELEFLPNDAGVAGGGQTVSSTHTRPRERRVLRTSTDEMRTPVMIGFEAYLRNDTGTEIVPGDKADWHDWVSASKTRNWCRKDPLLDWLKFFGAEKGYEQDPAPDRPGSP